MPQYEDSPTRTAQNMSGDQDTTCARDCGGCPAEHIEEALKVPISRSRRDSASGELNPCEDQAVTAVHLKLAWLKIPAEEAVEDEQDGEVPNEAATHMEEDVEEERAGESGVSLPEIRALTRQANEADSSASSPSKARETCRR